MILLDLEEAKSFSKWAHESIGQKRKYVPEPYWTHPLAVCELVKTWGMDDITQVGALFHDVPEDVYKENIEKGFEIIEEKYGKEVSDVVWYCTHISKPEDGNRATRKRIDREHYAKGCTRSQTIKIADAIHNLESIRLGDEEFFVTYLAEKKQMVELMERAAPDAKKAWEDYLLSIESPKNKTTPKNKV